jgi:hypothetical protein
MAGIFPGRAKPAAPPPVADEVLELRDRLDLGVAIVDAALATRRARNLTASRTLRRSRNEHQRFR